MSKQNPFFRSHGILMPIFSLNSPYGIGTLGKPAKDFVDFISRSKGTIWQMLPTGPTGYANSPYQCFSAFAGNAYFLDPLWFLEKGWITNKELEYFEKENTGKVDYGWLYKTRYEALLKVYFGFERFGTADDKNMFQQFKTKNNYWLDDYASFMTLEKHFRMVKREKFKSFSIKKKEAQDFINKNLLKEKEFYAFLEYVFSLQWFELKDYAKQKGVFLVGDMPLYVSGDSADVWANPKLFSVDEKGSSVKVAGVPPDMFSKSGQLWGNPIYNWPEHIKTDFDWWQKRISYMSEFFDIIRIDHFIGMCRYFEIPAGHKTAEKGVWREGPGKMLLDKIKAAAGDTKFIAEDLGVITKSVEKFIKESEFPRMKLLQFAFNGEDSPDLPHNFSNNNVVYTGTHDNQTLVSFIYELPIEVKRSARRYLNVKRNIDIPKALIRAGFSSVANTLVIPLPDYLNLDDRGRINTPSKIENNWEWRINNDLSNILADDIATLAKIYCRDNKIPTD